MRVAFIIPSLSNTGPVIVVQDLCKGLVAQGITCKVFYFDDICELQMPCEVEQIKFSYTIDFTQWDVVHSHMLRPDIWVAIHKPCSKYCKTRFVTTLHNPITHSEHPLCNRWMVSHLASVVWRNALRRMDQIVLLNSHTVSTLPKYLRRKSSVVFNGRDIERSTHISSDKDRVAIEALKRNYKIIGSVSSIDDRKGLHQVVEALVQLPDFAYVAVGDGPKLAALKELAVHLGVGDRCYFVGCTRNSKEYYSVFDVFTMTSRSEGFPLSLVEAAGYGIPTVLSDIKVFQAIIPDEMTILTYRLYDCLDLSAKIALGYTNRDVLSKNITKFYQEKLTVNRMALQYITLYHK